MKKTSKKAKKKWKKEQEEKLIAKNHQKYLVITTPDMSNFKVKKKVQKSKYWHRRNLKKICKQNKIKKMKLINLMKKSTSLEKWSFLLRSILNNHQWVSSSNLLMLVYKVQYLKILILITNKLYLTFKKKILMTKILIRTTKIKNTISI
jgi:hypothetical protein